MVVVVVGVGGCASTDGGACAVEALGVDNPLTGPSGAVAVYAPQKGADEDSWPTSSVS